MSPFITESVSTLLTNCQANHCCVSNLKHWSKVDICKFNLRNDRKLNPRCASKIQKRDWRTESEEGH